MWPKLCLQRIVAFDHSAIRHSLDTKGITYTLKYAHINLQTRFPYNPNEEVGCFLCMRNTSLTYYDVMGCQEGKI